MRSQTGSYIRFLDQSRRIVADGRRKRQAFIREGKDRLLHWVASSKCELKIEEVMTRRPDEETAWPGNESVNEWLRFCFGSKPIPAKRPDARNLNRGVPTARHPARKCVTRREKVK
jgi:hypothetical protein